jgi:spore maturation protein SpmB
MALNYIWIAFFIAGFAVALDTLIFTGNMQIFNDMVNAVFSNAKTGFEISLGLTGALTLWMGLLKVSEKGGVVEVLGRMIGPLFEKLFSRLPKGHPAYGSIMLNISTISTFVANFILISIIITFIVLTFIKKINVYDAFIGGVKEGFNTAIMIIPILIAILVAIGIFRASGSLDFIISGIANFFGWLGIDTQFTEALPVAFMKPLSGTGARGLMIDAITTNGPDSFISRRTCTMQGSADTPFYIVAVYFGSVGIEYTRYSIGFGLLADLAGFTTALFVAYLFFT